MSSSNCCFLTCIQISWSAYRFLTHSGNSVRLSNWSELKQQLELDMEQQTGSKQEKEYVKAVYCLPAYLTSMQSTSWETLGWKKHKLESRFPGEISITSDMQWHHPYGRKWRGTKEPLDENERAGGEKVGLKLYIQKMKIMATVPITSWEIDGETVSDFILGWLQNHCRSWLQPWIKRCLLLGRKNNDQPAAAAAKSL